MEITPIGFGAWAIGGGDWQFGWGEQDDRDSIAAIQRALELGMNWIDTAAIYGLGHSEEVVARALADWSGEQPYVFTKCGMVWDENEKVGYSLRKDSIRRECEASLHRLKRETLDLYQIHWTADELEETLEGWETLAALQRDAEAQPLAVEIQKNSTDPEVARAANLRIAASLVKKLEYEKAAEICDAAIKESTRPDVLADAWVTKGNLLLAQKEWDSALLAFLRVPVFYRDEKLFMPPAMLGSARAYRRLEDLERAKKSLNDLIATFPQSAEAALAKTELQKLQK